MEVGPMMIECPSCRKRLRVPPTAAGKKVKCPGCQTTIAIPAAVAPPPAEPAPAPAAPSGPENAFAFDTEAPLDETRRARREPKTPPPPPPGSKTASVFAVIFAVIGLVTYQVIVMTQFPRRPGEGFRVGQMLGAAVVGGVCAALGGALGFWLARKPKSTEDSDEDEDEE